MFIIFWINCVKINNFADAKSVESKHRIITDIITSLNKKYVKKKIYFYL